MLELYLAIGLIGLGVLANKKTKDQPEINVRPNQNLNQKNIYESNVINKINTLEKNRSKQYFNKAKQNVTKNNPYQSNVLFKTNYKPEQNLNRNEKISDEIIMNNLSPQNVNANPVLDQNPQNGVQEDFTHNNMVPFFGGSITQNTNFNNNIQVSRQTGREEITHHKKEQPPLFDNKHSLGHVDGMPNYNNIERFTVSNNRKNNLPFTQIRVAPGLGLDYGNEGRGSFHQFEINELIRPKNIDELRSLANPKVTYKNRIVSGKKIDKRSKMGDFKKYRPDKFYHNNPDRYLKTTGDVIKAKIRENVVAKDTEKQVQKEYTGAAGPASNIKPQKIPLQQKSRKNIYQEMPPSNPSSKDQWNQSAPNSDYGRKGIYNKPNERDITQKRTHLSNLITNVKALITPLQDTMKITKKQNTIGNNRPEGNMSLPNPSKITVYDPNDIAKTTIKETTINNEHEGHMTGPVRITVHDPNDVTRTTIKETTLESERDGNMSGPKRLTCYDPNDIAKTTIKETLIHNNRQGAYSDGYIRNKAPLLDEAKTTLRETLDPIDYNKHLKANNKHRVYEDNAKTTIKETTIDNKRITGNVEDDRGGGYMTNPKTAPNTHRQFTGDEEYTGQADGDVGRGGGEGYMTADYKAPNTSRQFTGDEEYMGHAGSVDEKAMSYDDKYRARLNINKERIARGRAPTQTGVKVAAGEENVNISHSKQMADVKFRPQENNRITNKIRTKEDYNLTSYKDSLSNKQYTERIQPEYLDQFKKNPYTQPLDSYGVTQ